MLVKTTNKITSFFISSVSFQLQNRVSNLTYLGRQAQFSRNYALVAAISEELKELCEPIGLYFEAVALGRQGEAKERTKAIKALEQLAEEAPAVIRASSLLSLGINEQEKGATQEAKRLLFQAARQSKDIAPVTHFLSMSAISGLLSQEGAQQQSLKILQAIHPAVRYWGGVYPNILGEQLNNLAYELYQVGELHTAWDYSQKACSMQCVVHFPEWLETKNEIESKRREQESKTFIPVPDSYEQNQKVFYLSKKNRKKDITVPLEPAKVLHFDYSSKRNKVLRVCLHYKGYTDILWDFYLYKHYDYNSAIVQLLCSLDELRATEATELRLSVQLLLNAATLFQSEMALGQSSIQSVFTICNKLQAEFGFSTFSRRHKFMTEEEITARTNQILERIATNKSDV